MFLSGGGIYDDMGGRWYNFGGWLTNRPPIPPEPINILNAFRICLKCGVHASKSQKSLQEYEGSGGGL